MSNQEAKPRDCSRCGTHCETWCPGCLAAFDYRQNVESMTGDERAAELEGWVGILEIPFDLMHQRFEELVGRPVYTHELGLNWEGLVEEARNPRNRPTVEQIINLIPEEKRIVINMGEDEPS